MQTHIYTLCDWDGAPRYIGKTIHALRVRLNSHLAEARRTNAADYYKNRWVRKCLLDGYEPTIKLITTVDGDGEKAECNWIERGRRLWNLTNSLTGGAGELTAERLKRLGNGNRGIPKSKEQKEKIRASCLGQHKTEATKQKMRKPKSAGHSEAVSAGRIKWWAEQADRKSGPITEQRREAIRAALVGKPKSESHKKHLREAKAHSEAWRLATPKRIAMLHAGQKRWLLKQKETNDKILNTITGDETSH